MGGDASQLACVAAGFRASIDAFWPTDLYQNANLALTLAMWFGQNEHENAIANPTLLLLNSDHVSQVGEGLGRPMPEKGSA